MEREPPDDLLVYLARFERPVVELMLATRDKVYEFGSDMSEFFLSVPYAVACNFSYTHSVKQAPIYIGTYTKHVNIGFCDGATLSDPEGRLKGEGKSMRHVSIRKMEDLDDPYLNGLIQHALDAAVHPPEPLAPKTVNSTAKAPGD